MSFKQTPKIIELNGDPYMTRWPLLSFFGFSIKLHVILRTDAVADLHDHPWSFISFLIAGSYVEQRPTGFNERKALSMVFRRATDAHRVIIQNGPCVSLVFCGRSKRQWGFISAEGKWLSFDDYEFKEVDVNITYGENNSGKEEKNR